MAKKWIKAAIKKPGSFTKQADKAGKTVAEMADAVEASSGKYSATTKKRAALAKTLMEIHK